MMSAGPRADDEGRFQAVFSSVPECVKRVDSDGRLIDINPAGLAMIDASSLDQVRGRNLLDLIDPAYHRAFREAIGTVFTGKSVQLQFEVVGFAGRRLWMDQSAAPLFDRSEPGKVIEMVAVTRDITAQRAAEATLLRAKVAEEVARAKSLFLANVGNDLKTPLNQIIGYSELLKEAALDRGRHEDIADIDRVLDAGARLSSMLNQMLAISLEETRRDSAGVGAFDLTELIGDAAALIKPILRASAARVVLDLDEVSQIWVGDREKLDQCLRSALSAAAEFATQGTITVGAKGILEGGRAQLRLEITAEGKRPDMGTSTLQAPPELGASALQLARDTARVMGGEMKISAEPSGMRLTLRVPARPDSPSPLVTAA